MTTTYDRSITTPYNSLNVTPDDIFSVMNNWFANRNPLTTRLPHGPVGSTEFKFQNELFRPRSVALANGATVSNSVTSFVVADSSVFDYGDVIKCESECMYVTGIDNSTNTLTITRAFGGTTAASHVDTTAVYLITNSRTGAAVDILPMSRRPTPYTQYCQTVQHAYAVGGSLQANSNFMGGARTPLDRDRMQCSQACYDDFERALYVGVKSGQTSSTATPTMAGLSQLCVTNNTTSPTNAAAYKPSDLVRDTFQACFDGGGEPSLLLVSTDFLTGLSTWGHTYMRIDAGKNIFGTPINLFAVPFLPTVNIVPAPLLNPGTAICLSTNHDEAVIRFKRTLIDKLRGSRGDATEGDMIMEGALELDNEAHHAFVTGITAFAKP